MRERSFSSARTRSQGAGLFSFNILFLYSRLLYLNLSFIFLLLFFLFQNLFSFHLHLLFLFLLFLPFLFIFYPFFSSLSPSLSLPPPHPFFSSSHSQPSIPIYLFSFFFSTHPTVASTHPSLPPSLLPTKSPPHFLQKRKRLDLAPPALFDPSEISRTRERLFPIKMDPKILYQVFSFAPKKSNVRPRSKIPGHYLFRQNKNEPSQRFTISALSIEHFTVYLGLETPSQLRNCIVRLIIPDSGGRGGGGGGLI